MSKVEQLITEHIDIWTSSILAKSTAGRGSNKKYELYGIKKLRELIFDLAVRGKLVAQDLNDEPASVLLERVITERTELVQIGKIKKIKPIAEITEAEQPFELPLGWEWTKLGVISEINGGFAFKSSKYIDDGVRVIRISDFDENGFKNDKIVRHLYSDDLSGFGLEENNILMAMTGGTVGKSLLVHSLPEPMVVNQRVATIKIHQGVNPNFINSLIRTDLIQSVIQEAKNSTNDNISMGDITNFFVPLPSASEQQRIVAKVDELMLLCDQLEQQTETSIDAHVTLVEVLLATLTDSADANELAQNWARVSEHFATLFTTEQSIEALKQTLLQLAVMGKLVPQDPDDEPAAVLLEKIAAEKAQLIKDKKIKKEKPLPPIGDDEKPFELPQGWEWCQLDALSLSSEAGWSPQCEPAPREGDNWGVLKISAVTWGKYQPDENKTLPASLEPRPQYEVKAGDFLISRANTAELVARAVVVPSAPPVKLMMSDKIIRFVFSENIFSEYINLANNSSYSRQYYAAVAGGTSSSMKNVSRNQVRALAIALPPYSEQHRIVAKLNELMNMCEQLKTNLQQSQETQVQLTDALVDQALVQ